MHRVWHVTALHRPSRNADICHALQYCRTLRGYLAWAWSWAGRDGDKKHGHSRRPTLQFVWVYKNIRQRRQENQERLWTWQAHRDMTRRPAGCVLNYSVGCSRESMTVWRVARVFPNTGFLINTDEERRFRCVHVLRKQWQEPTGNTSLCDEIVALYEGICKPSRAQRKLRRHIHVEAKARQQREATNQRNSLPKMLRLASSVIRSCALSFPVHLKS